MSHTSLRSRIAAGLMSLAVCASLFAGAGAVTVPADVIDAKDELATVDITQIYNGSETDTATHNYATAGTDVDISYSATLRMTEEMAIYLTARQSQLLSAKFCVHVEMDTKLLEFSGSGDTVTVTFSSTFLKPWDVDANDQRTYPAAFSDYKAGAYTSSLVSCVDGVFTYEISVDRAWAESYAAQHGYIDVPMELINYFDGTTAYAYEDIPASAASQKPMFCDFDESDWMHEITVAVAGMQVRDGVAESVTFDPATWQRVTATGTVDGEFTYERAHKITTIADYAKVADPATLEFGNDFATGDKSDIIEEWTSNEVWVYLIRHAGGGTVNPDSPYLNLDDHFAYVIGYPDGNVKPLGTITRAEVATIFFRMLTDEVRNEFWCQTNPYSDVDLDDWFNNTISTLTNLGVINGYADGGFHPNANITRAEFATIAVRFFLITEDMYGQIREDAFTDIADHWANEYINMAYLLNIVSGYPDGTYLPDKVINRAEAMTIVNNTLRRSPCVEGIEPMEKDEGYISWPDNADKNVWYFAAVQEATNSHAYQYFSNENTKELWTEILPVRDWAAFEKAWSDANSAANPGEVVGHH